MIVIKFGGHAMTDAEGLFAQAVQGAIDLGEECVIVHGGGPQIDAALKVANVESEFTGGFRVTSPSVFAIVQRVLGGEVLRNVVAQLRSAGLNAVGITGRDGGLLIAKRLTQLVNGAEVDLGQVGDVVRVDTAILETLIDSGFLPVVSPIATEAGHISVEAHLDVVGVRPGFERVTILSSLKSAAKDRARDLRCLTLVGFDD